MNTTNYSDIFETRFMNFEHFKRFPQLMPWVGKDFEKYGALLIGESHYLPKSSNIHLKSENWYKSSSIDLTNEEKSYTNTVNIISSGYNRKWDGTEHSIFKNIENAIFESGFLPTNTSNLFRYTAFYNFFQRPALNGNSLNYDIVDRNMSIDTFMFIIDLIKPKYIMVLSKKPWNILRKSQLINWTSEKQKYFTNNLAIAERFPHPGCVWWNKENKNYQLNLDGIWRTGKQNFIDFIINEHIFS